MSLYWKPIHLIRVRHLMGLTFLFGCLMHAAAFYFQSKQQQNGITKREWFYKNDVGKGLASHPIVFSFRFDSVFFKLRKYVIDLFKAWMPFYIENRTLNAPYDLFCTVQIIIIIKCILFGRATTSRRILCTLVGSLFRSSTSSCVLLILA